MNGLGAREVGEHKCPLGERVVTYPTPEETRFIEAVLRAQQSAAVDELGDELIEDPARAEGWAKEAAVTERTLHIHPRHLARHVARCLEARYMGHCGVAESCNGALYIEERIANTQSVATES